MANISKTKYTSQYIDNMGFDDELKVPMVEIISKDGVLVNPATEETLQKVAGMNYDTLEVDKSDPTNIIIVKKLAGVAVDTKTIKIL